MNSRELIVRGIGKVAAAPDLIVLNMRLETCKSDYEKTMQRGVKMLDALRSAIASAGHDAKELKTTSFDINTKYDHHKEKGAWKQRFIGYVCVQGLRLEFDLNMALLGATIGAIAECEANPDFNIKFSIKDPHAVSEQLLESAIADAKWKATVLAKSAGVKLGAIQRIDYDWREVHVYSDTEIHMGDFLYQESETRPMEIEPKEINVSDTATVVWAIE